MKFKSILMLIFTVLFAYSTVFANDNVVVPALMYHNINDDYEDKNASVEISGQMFKEQMLALKENGYTSIFFNEYLDAVNNKKELPEKPILITFDDGYLNNFTVGYPILKETGMKATIFIVTGRMGLQGAVTYPHFTWQQALEMEKSGYIDIQSHTQYHSHLPMISNSNLTLELRKSKFIIEKNLGKKVNILAYPYGEWNENVINSAKKAGYDACVLADPGYVGVNSLNENTYLMKRITVYGHMSGQQLIEEIKKNESDKIEN